MRSAELLAAAAASTTKDAATHEFFHHSSGKNTHTDAVITEAIYAQYPTLHLTVTPKYAGNYTFDILEFAAAGFASCTPMEDSNDKIPSSLQWKLYVPPPSKVNGSTGFLVDEVNFSKYLYGYSQYVLYYIVGPSEADNEGLIRAVAEYCIEPHNQVWVFDQGFWDKNYELYDAMQKASWDDVILDAQMKDTIRNDVYRFFDSRERYEKLKVPWKRGIIYYGPPGNGKTISIKALMHSLHSRDKPVLSLYVRTLRNIWGPEYAIASIFAKARQVAPCMLIFEDLDSMVEGDCRSYFLNEVDGIRPNDGVLMIGSTNHLDRLDPGIAKRPSRFDRKFLFPKPNHAERTQYCEYWRGKLADNKDIEFPKALSPEIASITDDFSFAYLQEAFIATLLAIASQQELDDANSPRADPQDLSSPPSPTLNPQPPPAAALLAQLLAHIDPAAAASTSTSTSTPIPPSAANLHRTFEKLLLGAAPAPAVVAKDKFDDLLLWREIKKQVAILREEM